MNESTITKTSFEIIEDALAECRGECSKYFPYYVSGVIDVTNALLEKEKELKKKATNNQKPKKKSFFI